MKFARPTTRFLRRVLSELSRPRQLYYKLYYKEVFRRRILDTPSVACDTNASVEVHALTCERDYLDLIWCLKTFRHFSGLVFHLVIHDDGSLSDHSRALLASHFSNARIISKVEADQEMDAVLKDYAYCRRLRVRMPLAKKLFDFLHFASRENFLILDSDVLFFSSPHRMVQAIGQGTMFFLSDCIDAYLHAPDILKVMYGLEVVPKFNSGLAYLSKDVFDYPFMEQYCRSLAPEELYHPHVEQTLIALLVSRCGKPCERLPDSYGIYQPSLPKLAVSKPINWQTVSHHFVNDGSRPRFYSEGLRYLRKSGFLATISGCA